MALSPGRKITTVIGLSGCVALSLGTAVIFAAAGFLAYFWGVSTATAKQSHQPPAVWYNIVRSGWATKTVTLSSAFLRLAVGLQGGLVTAMLASLLIENRGVHLSKLPALSIMRSVKTSPHNLVGPFAQGPFGRQQVFYGGLVLLAIIVSVGSQFISTLLLLDFGDAYILTPWKKGPLGFGLDMQGPNGDLSATQGVDYWNSQPPIYPRFAEMTGQPYLADGIQDTGLSFRAYVPFGSTAERATLRQFKGLTKVLESRVVCVRPTIDNLQIYKNWGYNEYRSLSGNFSSAVPYSNISTSTREGAEDTKPYFNCTLSMWDSTSPYSNVNWRISLCLPVSGSIGFPSDDHILDNTGSRNDQWSNFLVFNTSGGLDTTWPTKGLLSDWTQSSSDVWTTWKSQDGSNMLSASMCFSFFAEPSTFEVEITASQVFEEPTPVWEPSVGHFSTKNITNLYCTHCSSTSSGDTGRMELHLPSNWTKALVNTTEITGKYEVSELYDSLKQGFFYNPNWNWAMPTVLLTHDVWAINQIHVDVFQDIIEETGNVALAMQSLFTILTQRSYYDWLSRFDVAAYSEMQFLESHSVPVRWVGLGIVLGLLLVHIVLLVAITAMLLLMTDRSFLGSSWPAVAQIVAADKEGVLAYASDMTDGQVEKHLSSQGKEKAIYRIGYYNSF